MHPKTETNGAMFLLWLQWSVGNLIAKRRERNKVVSINFLEMYDPKSEKEHYGEEGMINFNHV